MTDKTDFMKAIMDNINNVTDEERVAHAKDLADTERAALEKLAKEKGARVIDKDQLLKILAFATKPDISAHFSEIIHTALMVGYNPAMIAAALASELVHITLTDAHDGHEMAALEEVFAAAKQDLKAALDNPETMAKVRAVKKLRDMK